MVSKKITKIIAVTVLLGSTLLINAQAVDFVAASASENSSDSHNVPVVTVGSVPEAPSAAPVGGMKERQNQTPKVELFLGYSYIRGVPTYASGNRMVDLNGGTASVAFNLNRYFGLVADVAGFRDTQLNLTGLGANPPRVADSSGSVFTYLFGPRLSYRKYERITPFAQALFGGVHASQVTLSGCTGTLCTPLPSQNAFAFTAGGGLDLKVHRHIAIRVVQAEYMMTRFADVTTGASNTQNDLRLSAGLVLRFGGETPALPVSFSCAASPASVYPGDPISVTGTALNLNPKRTTTYTWTTDGGRMSGSTEIANIDLKDVAPGSYTAKGHVSQGNKPDRFADCTAPYTVMAFQPPTVSCSAAPSTVHPGESAIITAVGVSPQSRPLTYSYSASDGSINGTTPSATLTTSSAPGTVNVTCNVVDDKGQTATSTTTVTVAAPAPPPAPTTQSLCSLHFDRDAKRPTRVDNEAKACLDDIALNLQRSSDAKVAVEGNSDANEKTSNRRANNASLRAINTKHYLVTEKGIDPSRVTIYTGSSDSKTVDMILIPSGASLDMTGLTPVTSQ
jgi:opacity protein-like surface antigen